MTLNNEKIESKLVNVYIVWEVVSLGKVFYLCICITVKCI